MTAEKLHDAISLLPSDLIAAADKKRHQKPRSKPAWRQLGAIAACFAVVLACGMFLRTFFLAGSGGSSKSTAAPAMGAPESVEATPSMAAPQEAARDTVTSEDAAAAEAAPAEKSENYALSSASQPNPTDFAVRLLQNSHSDGENTLISPLSVLSCLTMTANGAEGDTLAQMETALGMPTRELNDCLSGYMDSQSDALKLANAIWFAEDDRLTVEQSFLDTNTRYFQADLYRAAMNQETCDAINRWVNEKTAGMIPSILDSVPEDAVMYLVNALAFEAQWASPYFEQQVDDAVFTKEDGTEQNIHLMHSTERQYLEDELATGFIKLYEGGKYAFAVLLPNEGVTVEAYLDSLTGAHLREMLENPTETTVYAALPKFEAEYGTELSETLKAMGMTDAFDSVAADFSGIGTCTEGNLYISRVIHKTFISVAEQGTKAGAATLAEMAMGAALIQDTKTVTLDRPFVYMLIDCAHHFPFFIGTMMDMGA